VNTAHNYIHCTVYVLADVLSIKIIILIFLCYRTKRETVGFLKALLHKSCLLCTERSIS